jgi:hypothetical protein
LEKEREKNREKEGEGARDLCFSVLSARTAQGGAPPFLLARPAALPLFLSLQAIL